MRSGWLAALIVLLPAASACSAGVPPTFDMDLAGLPDGRCSVGNETAEVEGCLALPEGFLLLDGTVTWGWSDAPCTAEAMPPVEDVIIGFSVVHPDWLRVSAPGILRITPADQLDPQTYSADPNAEPGNVVRHDITKLFGLSVSIERQPSDVELVALEQDGGIARILVKARASQSYGWMESFSSEFVSFDARSLLAEHPAEPATADGQVVPVPGLALAAAALLAVALLRRR